MILIDHRVKVGESTNTVMLLQQFLPAIRQISSEFFIFQQDDVPAYRTLEAINFSQKFAKRYVISSILSKHTQ